MGREQRGDSAAAQNHQRGKGGPAQEGQPGLPAPARLGLGPPHRPRQLRARLQGCASTSHAPLVFSSRHTCIPDLAGS